MWTKEITDMIINGVWATLYMTVASTDFRISIWPSDGCAFGNHG